MNISLRPLLSLFAAAALAIAFPTAASPLFSQFSLGVGDRLNWDNPVGSGDYSTLQFTTDLLQSHGVTAAQARYVTIWMVEGWEESWFPAAEVQTHLIDQGFTPVFVHWWFADDTRPAVIQSKETAYYADLSRVGSYLKQLKGTVLLVLEPEFNTDPTDELNNWSGFSTVLLNGKAAVAAQAAGSEATILYGTAPGPWDSAAELQPAMGAFAQQADFLGVQSMYASTYQSAAETLAGADEVLARLTEYYDLYGKPTFLPYFVISSYDAATGSPSGWEETQSQAIQRFRELCPELVAKAHTFGIAYMMLADDPNHHGFFGEGEYHFGLMDAYFNTKPAFDALFGGVWNCSPAPQDSDGDGFSDTEETAAGSNPFDPASRPPGDEDDDGIPNAVDPAPFISADGACSPVNGIATIAYRTYSGIESCTASDTILTGHSVKVGTSANPAELHYTAGRTIRLHPGFEAPKGSRFEGRVAPAD